MRALLTAMLGLTLSSVATAQEVKDLPKAPAFEPGQKWVYVMTNFAKPERRDVTIELMRRAKKLGYNGMMVADTKFDKWSIAPAGTNENIRMFRKACTEEGMKFIASVAPFGYCDTFLSNDPNLAEGMPVRDAEFVVKDGKLVPFDETTKLANPGFEEWKGDAPVGWQVDEPGRISFHDDAAKHAGAGSLRQQEVGSGATPGRGRLYQKIAGKPWHYYHVSIWAKTEGCTNKDNRIFGYDGQMPLNWQAPDLKKTADWTQFHVSFCSLNNTELSLYVGTWAGKEGKVWYDDIAIEPGGFVNVVRRDGCPLKVTSPDGKTVYEEGKDFAKVADPKLYHDPNPGYFTIWHDAPVVTIPDGSRLKEGDHVLASYHFATNCGKSNNVNICMSEPKTYELIEQQVRWMKETGAPDAYLLSHDEMRLNGWDDPCVKTGKTNGQILADNIRRCIEIVKRVDPGKPIMVWNDMFDPFHNARKETDDGKPFTMYMVKGGNWWGSWEGLSSDVVVCNWMYNSEKSLGFFADRGNQQILAGYYDGDPARIVPWMEKAGKVKGFVGVMYTTWRDDYSKLDAFMEQVKKYEAGAAKP